MENEAILNKIPEVFLLRLIIGLDWY